MVNEIRPSSIRARSPLRSSHEVSSATSRYLTSNDTTKEEDSYRQDSHDDLDDSNNSDRIFSGKNFSRSLPNTPARPPKQRVTSSPQANSKQSASAKSNWSLKLIFGIAVPVLVACYCHFGYTNNTTTTRTKIYCDFKGLRERYPEQSEVVWKALSVGIENILNKVSYTPGVYLLVYKEGKSVKRLIRDIATASSKCFGDTLELVEMSASDFNSDKVKNDFGYAIDKFRSKMENGKVALIANLNEIPAETARALHTICDTISPLVTDVVIFLTLQVPAELGTSIVAAEEVLHQLWGSKLKRNELDPLITRVTDQIVQIKN